VLSLGNASRAEIASQLALVAFVVTRVLPAFNRLAMQAPTLTRGVPYVQSIFKLVDALDAVGSRDAAVEGRELSKDWRLLRLDRVCFQYPGAAKLSLIDVELSLDRGGFYGFIGQSGAGKTTLANLLLGLIDSTAGAVRVDEIPLPLLSRTSWQKSFGYVPQDPFILDGTVRENITFGQPASDDEIWRALRLARLRDVVERLDGKLDARVGENGRQLSGGQVQRLAIARALLRAPDVLFLDEATSALDTLTEAELLGTLSELRGQTTIIMITHRMHALRDCDNIFVLENGRLIAKGTYDELEKNSRQFCELATIDVPALQGG
jgi:ABC-type multidrug transport system fused ATPase/permease subunit